MVDLPICLDYSPYLYRDTRLLGSTMSSRQGNFRRSTPKVFPVKDRGFQLPGDRSLPHALDIQPIISLRHYLPEDWSFV